MRNPIYEPTGRAAEYAHLALNIYNGCDNCCSYCWGPSVLQMKPKEFHQVVRRKGLLAALDKQLPTLAGTDKRVLLCFACDPYPKMETKWRLTGHILTMLSNNDIPFQVLSKSGARALADLPLYGPRDAYAASLTLINPKQSKKLEPNAALPQERFETLKAFHDAGIPTWVSLEPVIDHMQTLEIIRQTHKFVDLYKVGKMNYQKSDIDWVAFYFQVINLLELFHKNYFIKSDLAKFGPKGDENNYTDNRTVTPLGERSPNSTGEQNG